MTANRSLQILVVDDSSFARKILRGILEPAGHTVREAGSGEEALEQYYVHKPHLVFLDQIMGEMKGLDVLAKLKELDPQSQVVLATADVQTTTFQEAMRLGACEVITKPFESARVLDAVEACRAQSVS